MGINKLYDLKRLLLDVLEDEDLKYAKGMATNLVGHVEARIIAIRRRPDKEEVKPTPGAPEALSA
jgi:hypothetical protein